MTAGEHPTAEGTDSVLGDTLPILDLDHPGASDPAYRRRRVHIATLAQQFRSNPDGPVPVVDYTADEDQVWQQCCEALTDLHVDHACQVYHDGRRKLALPTDAVPQLGEVSARLRTFQGVELWPVQGLVLPQLFLSHLERGIMLSTQYVRHPSRPFFTPEPDIVHELLGHAPMFTDGPFAAFSRMIGRAARLANPAQLDQLSNIYWFTVEFGLIEEGGDAKAFGAGLLGGVEDLRRAFSDEADIRPFDLEQVAHLEYDYNHPQPVYFVIPSFEQLCSQLEHFVATWTAD